jgi:hypothetical protein
MRQITIREKEVEFPLEKRFEKLILKIRQFGKNCFFVGFSLGNKAKNNEK